MSASRPDPWDWRSSCANASSWWRPRAGPLAEAAGRLLPPSAQSRGRPGPGDVRDGRLRGAARELTAPGESVPLVSGDSRPARAVWCRRARDHDRCPVPRGADAVIPVETPTPIPSVLPRAGSRSAVGDGAAAVHPHPGEEIARGEVLAARGERIGRADRPGRHPGLGALPVRSVCGWAWSSRRRAGAAARPASPGRRWPTAPSVSPTAPCSPRPWPRRGPVPGSGAPATIRASRCACSSRWPTAIWSSPPGASGTAPTTWSDRRSARACRHPRFEHLALRPVGPRAGPLPGGRRWCICPAPRSGPWSATTCSCVPVAGAEAAPVPARLGTLPDGGAQRRARPGLLAQPGRLRRGPEGAAVVDLLAGRRLAPYGRADAMVLQDGGAANPGDPVLVIAL